MSDQLMLYGSSEFTGLVAKIGVDKAPGRVAVSLLPYGSGESALIAAKVGISKCDVRMGKALKVVRLNARKR